MDADPPGFALTERPDVAILATKAQDAATALAANATRLDGVPLVVAQNGLGGLAVAHRELPGSPLVGALALFAASYLEPGHITVTGTDVAATRTETHAWQSRQEGR